MIPTVILSIAKNPDNYFYTTATTMKHLLIIILLSSLILAGCSQQKIAENTLLMIKEQECEKYKEFYENDSSIAIVEIFYSKTFDSCLIAYLKEWDQETFSVWEINDILQERNYFRLKLNRDDDWNILGYKHNKIQEKIQELKGE